ncbi:MAG: cytochrome c nitrite reductase small subunit [Planctomycetota bacterium]|nr:cytochrome c nitrite reductase small subunit [Planctomycetota bacterium]
MRRTTLLLILLFGVLLGAGAYTFTYAEGGSYLSDDPRACTNCHIMESHFDSWQKSSHHGVATCNDCHLPQGFFEKYYAKSLNGWNHSKAFTLQDFPEPIRITDANSKILQDNCIRCHSELTHEIAAGASQHDDATRCTHCHRSAGHGETVGLGGPFQASEIPEESR